MLRAEIVNYSKSHRRVWCRLHPLFILGILLLIIFLMAFSFRVGGQYYAKQHTDIIVQGYQTALELQNNDIQTAKDDAEKSLNVLVTRLGQLEHQLQRLSTLGNKLAASNNLQEVHVKPKQPLLKISSLNSNNSVKVSDFVAKLERLSHKIQHNNDSLHAMQTIMLKKSIADNNYPSLVPVDSYISSGFGWRDDPLKKVKRRMFHKGLDFPAKIGTAIKSAAAGIVSWSGPRNNYGNLIEIDHGNGYITRYAHIDKLYVKVGDKVNKGQLIASVGDTGRSTGPHLHFEVAVNGKPQDPKRYMQLN